MSSNLSRVLISLFRKEVDQDQKQGKRVSLKITNQAQRESILKKELNSICLILVQVWMRKKLLKNLKNMGKSTTVKSKEEMGKAIISVVLQWKIKFQLKMQLTVLINSIFL